MIKSDDFEDLHFEVEYSRNSLRYITETLGKMVDGVVVGFLKNDEYYYLGVNNLLANSESQDMHTTKAIIQFLEDKKIMSVLDTKMIKSGRVYYTFIDDDTGAKAISCLYTRVSVNQYDGIVCIL
jgi:transcriptional regulator of heat shock response